MTIWNCGKNVELNIGDSVTVFKCGSGHTVFGERATLTKVTKLHLVFTTESGAQVKTPVDNMSVTVGKARAERYCVSTRAFDSFENMIEQRVSFWNDKTHKFDTK